MITGELLRLALNWSNPTKGSRCSIDSHCALLVSPRNGLNLTKLNTDSFIHILGLNSAFVKPKSVWSKWSNCSAMCGYNGRRIRILTCFYGNHNYNCTRRESCVSPSCSSTGEHLNISKEV